MNFVDARAEFVFRQTPLEDVIKKGYDKLSFDELVIERSYELNDSLEVKKTDGGDSILYAFFDRKDAYKFKTMDLMREFDPELFFPGEFEESNDQITNHFSGGQSKANVAHSELKLGPLNKDLERQVRVNVYQDFYPRIADSAEDAEREFNLMQRLSMYEGTNIAQVKDLSGKTFLVENTKPSLFEKYNVIEYSDIPKEEIKSEFKEEVQRLVKEAANISWLLTEGDEKELGRESLTDKNYTGDHVVNDYSYHTHYIEKTYQLEGSNFEEFFEPIQKAMQYHAENNPAIVTDRSSKNKGDKNFDFGYVTKTSLISELARIVSSLPKMFSIEEQISFVQEGINEWNNLSENKITFDKEAQLAYLGEAYYRNARLLDSALNDAKDKRENLGGSEYYYDYARDLYMAICYREQAKELVEYFYNENVIGNVHAEGLINTLGQLDERADQITTHKDFIIDSNIYRILKHDREEALKERRKLHLEFADSRASGVEYDSCKVE